MSLIPEQSIKIETYRPSLKQAEAHKCDAKELLYGGAKGGGKSYYLCNEAFKQCRNYPGNRIWLGRKRAKDFKDTTLITFKKTIDSRLYRQNEQKEEIYFPQWKSTIVYGGLEKQLELQKFNSAEYGWVGIDQAEECDQDDFAMAKATLRHRLPDGSSPAYQIRLTANPKKCWLRPHFILHPEPYSAFIRALPTDNPHLPEGYIETLRETFKYRPELLRAYLEGLWEDIEGINIVIKDEWVRRAVDRPAAKFWQSYKIVSADVARYGDNETVIYLFECRKIIDQMIYSQKATTITADNVAELRKRSDAKLDVIDGDGIGGGVCDNLRRMNEPLLELHSNSKPDIVSGVKFRNLRAQMWWNAMEMFADGTASIPNDETLINQLSSIWYEETNGLICVADKEEMKQAGLVSPDRADSAVYGWWGCRKWEKDHKMPSPDPLAHLDPLSRSEAESIHKMNRGEQENEDIDDDMGNTY